MRYLTLLVPLLLSGCFATTPTFPDIPLALQKTCPDLIELAVGTEKMSDLLDTINVNYKTYHECRVRVDAWHEWHKEQKKIFDKAK